MATERYINDVEYSGMVFFLFFAEYCGDRLLLNPSP